jgi:hypothetical protein
MNVGAFAVVSHFANAGERYVTLEDYEGLGRTSPLLAATLSIFLLSLIGIPMTGGFFDTLDNRHLSIGPTSYHGRVVCVEDLRLRIEFADRVIIRKGVLFGVILRTENCKRIKGHDSSPLILFRTSRRSR